MSSATLAHAITHFAIQWDELVQCAKTDGLRIKGRLVKPLCNLLKVDPSEAFPITDCGALPIYGNDEPIFGTHMNKLETWRKDGTRFELEKLHYLFYWGFMDITSLTEREREFVPDQLIEIIIHGGERSHSVWPCELAEILFRCEGLNIEHVLDECKQKHESSLIWLAHRCPAHLIPERFSWVLSRPDPEKKKEEDDDDDEDED